jgi:hypothetical protein
MNVEKIIEVQGDPRISAYENQLRIRIEELRADPDNAGLDPRELNMRARSALHRECPQIHMDYVKAYNERHVAVVGDKTPEGRRIGFDESDWKEKHKPSLSNRLDAWKPAPLKKKAGRKESHGPKTVAKIMELNKQGQSPAQIEIALKRERLKKIDGTPENLNANAIKGIIKRNKPD